MFECRSCIFRGIEAIVGDRQLLNTLRQSPLILAPRLVPQSQRRGLATSTTSTRTLPSRRNRQTELQPKNDETADATAAAPSRDQKALRMELRYLTDPLKFAKHVHYTLQCEKPEKALDLCRLASRTMDCVVAWNHTVDWHMRRGKINEAIKIYNEMKKRAQFPDSYTYMLLFRGFPQYRSHHDMGVKKQMAQKAVAIYNSMFAPTSKVKPNVMHTNAVLRVCSLAQDMDALWTVAGKLPQSGASSPDHVTYTILLGAIRHNAFGEGDSVESTQMSSLRQQAVNEGRRIWLDIITRWRKGEIIIDESLVCEMANLLLVSRRMEDWDDVLNLIQQTTGIKRLLAPLGSPERKVDHVPKEEEQAEITAEDDSEGWVPTPSSDAFLEVNPLPAESSNSTTPNELVWVKPRNDILNAIITACNRMRASKTVYAYWDVFVKQFNIVPDLYNFHTLLGIMRLNRNSGKAAGLLQTLHAQHLELQNKTFRMAMAVCSRDVKNPNVVENATTMIDVMFKALPAPDYHTLVTYLSIAVTTRDGAKISSALEKLMPLAQSITDDDKGRRPEIKHEKNFDKENALELFRSMIGAIDTIVGRNLIPGPTHEQWKARQSELDSLVGRLSRSFRQDDNQRELRRNVVNQYSEARRSFRHREAEMVRMGLKKPRMAMSTSDWSARTQRYRRAK